MEQQKRRIFELLKLEKFFVIFVQIIIHIRMLQHYKLFLSYPFVHFYAGHLGWLKTALAFF